MANLSVFTIVVGIKDPPLDLASDHSLGGTCRAVFNYGVLYLWRALEVLLGRLGSKGVPVAALVLPRPCVSEPVSGADEALRLRLLVEAFTWSLQAQKQPWYLGAAATTALPPAALRALPA